MTHSSIDSDYSLVSYHAIFSEEKSHQWDDIEFFLYSNFLLILTNIWVTTKKLTHAWWRWSCSGQWDFFFLYFILRAMTFSFTFNVRYYLTRIQQHREESNLKSAHLLMIYVSTTDNIKLPTTRDENVHFLSCIKKCQQQFDWLCNVLFFSWRSKCSKLALDVIEN